MSTVALLAVALLASVSLAWALGASRTSPPLAPAVGAGALTVMRAALLVGALAAAGAVLQGGSVSETVGNDLVIGVDPHSGTTIPGIRPRLLYVNLAFGIALSPDVLLSSYMIRILTVSKHSLESTVFTLDTDEELRFDR